MDSDPQEEEELRSVALENARSILRARQRAERELMAAKEALEQKTQELAGSVAMLQATLESTFDGILVTNGERKVTGFNEKYLKMWGLPRDFMNAADHSHVLEFCARQCQDPERYAAGIDEIYAGSPPETADVLTLRNGQIYERFSTIQYVNGQNVGRVWSFRNITDQQRAEAELRQQREWLQVTLASIGDAVITTDIQGRITFINPVAEELTGWRSATACGLPLENVFKIINEYTRRPALNPVAAVLREGATVALANHTALIARDGSEIAIEDSAAPIRNPQGDVSGAVMVFRDVTARRRADEALREADRRKDDFLATLAHELRNPLAPIRQAALISKAEGASDAQKRWSHDVIERQVQHMALLLDDLLDISRVTRGTLVLRIQPTDLQSIIDSAVETARPVIDSKRHVLSIDVQNAHLQFDADPLRLAQILSNVLTNAAKYTEPGGEISIAANCTPEQVAISVADTGIGLSADSLPKIFEMFAQVPSTRDRSEGGLGIGLALTKGLVEMHGGKIDVRSAGLGRGCEFTIRLPRRDAEPQQTAALPKDSPVATPGRRVLIADDNRDAAESLAALLQIYGHEVTIVHDGHEALAAFAKMSPQVVLLDIGMPGLDGHEVAQKIRQQHSSSGARLIAITGWGQEDDKTRASAAGFDFHLTKPVDINRLCELLLLELAE